MRATILAPSLLILALFCTAAADPALGQKAEADSLPTIAEVVDGMQRIDGYYPLYRDKNKLYAYIRADQIDQEFLMATSIARGRRFFGWQWSDALMAWRRNEKQLMLVAPDVWHRAQSSSPIATAVEDTYTDTIIRTVPILAEDKKGNVVIDLGKLYMQSPEAFLGRMAKNTDASLARLNTIKAFPQNLEISVDLYAKDRDTGYASLMTAHFSLSSIPKSSYRPRHADDRVGYFLSVVKDYSSAPREPTNFVRNINRWHLEKADPKLAMSPPKEPIVFYLDKNIPVRYRRYVREGVLEWNKAFEALGFADALVVRQQTATNEFADYDPEDVRYNFVRWITSDVAFAMAPTRANPRTGEILDADIVVDDAMMRWALNEYDLLIRDGMTSTLSPELRDYLAEHPERHPGRFLQAERDSDDALVAATRASMFGGGERIDPYAPGGPLDISVPHGRGLCTIGHGRTHQLSMASLLLAVVAEEAEGDGEGGAGEEWPEEFVGQYLKELVMHEVGHTLGLRHNFKASAWRGLGELRATSDDQLSASVMDYNALNIAEGGNGDTPFLNVTIGPYDYWAIEYGYKVTGAADPQADRQALAEVTARVAESGLAYATDEDVWTSDPLVSRWDLGDDPLAFASYRLTLFDTLKASLVERTVKEGQSYARARRALSALLFDVQYASGMAARYVGGTYIHRDHRGDPNERAPLESVPVAKQREALAMIAENVLSDGAFELPPDLANKLTAGRWTHWGSMDYLQDPSYELHDRILTVQLWTLFRLVNPVTLRHVYDAELRLPAEQDAMTLPELLTTLTDTIFSEVQAGQPAALAYSNRRPYISSIRRNLQREYVAELTKMALDQGQSYPRAARTLAWDQLRQLGEAIDSMNGRSRLDDYSAAHLRECRARIERAINAEYSISG